MNLSEENSFGNGLLYVGFNQDQGNIARRWREGVVWVYNSIFTVIQFVSQFLQVVSRAERRTGFVCLIVTR